MMNNKSTNYTQAYLSRDPKEETKYITTKIINRL